MYKLFFISFFYFLETGRKANKLNKKIIKSWLSMKPYKSLKINSIKGQLSDKVKKILENKYWLHKEKNDDKIDVSYEIFDFLDFLYIKVKITVKKNAKIFAIRHDYSKNVDWRHDFNLINKIAKEINYRAQVLVKR